MSETDLQYVLDLIDELRKEVNNLKGSPEFAS